ncbi:hypothetical protein CEXT_171001 [Caerostris extrusa]|uniref:Uncharacterized protein n=1 Tax=Caerostris extrusa TaxID=172846 RepID=A0AAV4XSY4_CAEEX|nr:hypothetical protein CEXT_171001 [Caerostris extrusa]
MIIFIIQITDDRLARLYDTWGHSTTKFIQLLVLVNTLKNIVRSLTTGTALSTIVNVYVQNKNTNQGWHLDLISQCFYALLVNLSLTGNRIAMLRSADFNQLFALGYLHLRNNGIEQSGRQQLLFHPQSSHAP